MLSASRVPILFCCDFGAFCDCSQGSTASGQCEEASYASCCGAGTPCDCSTPPLNVTVYGVLPSAHHCWCQTLLLRRSVTSSPRRSFRLLGLSRCDRRCFWRISRRSTLQLQHPHFRLHEDYEQCVVCSLLFVTHLRPSGVELEVPVSPQIYFVTRGD